MTGKGRRSTRSSSGSSQRRSSRSSIRKGSRCTNTNRIAHALHHRTGKIRDSHNDTDKRANEVVAEVAAAVLVNIFEGQAMGRQAISYIEGYGAKKKHLLLLLLLEIMEVVDWAINLSSMAIN